MSALIAVILSHPTVLAIIGGIGAVIVTAIRSERHYVNEQRSAPSQRDFRQAFPESSACRLPDQ